MKDKDLLKAIMKCWWSWWFWRAITPHEALKTIVILLKLHYKDWEGYLK